MNLHHTSRRAIGLLLLAPAILLAASDGTQVVTRRGTATVTLDDVDAYVEVIPPAQRAEFVDSGKRVETMLQNLLMAQQLANEQRELEKSKGVDPLLAARLRFVENEARAQYHLAKLREQAPKVGVVFRIGGHDQRCARSVFGAQLCAVGIFKQSLPRLLRRQIKAVPVRRTHRCRE